MDFSGKVAISTGAASGMGLLFAQNWAALGGNVVLCDVNEQVLAEKPKKSMLWVQVKHSAFFVTCVTMSRCATRATPLSKRSATLT